METTRPKIDTLRRIELTEGVAIRLRMAGPMVRALAWLIDAAIQMGLWLVLLIIWLVLTLVAGANVSSGIAAIIFFLLYWFYYVFFEAGKRGATPGKRAMGLRVVRTSGAPISISQAVVRNFMRTIDFLPPIYFAQTNAFPIPTYAFGLAACAFTRNFQRLGDLAANTVVIYNDRPHAELPLSFHVDPVAPTVPLTREEQLAITGYLERFAEWSDQRREELASHLQPLTGASGQEGVRRLLGMGLWIRQESA